MFSVWNYRLVSSTLTWDTLYYKWYVHYKIIFSIMNTCKTIITTFLKNEIWSNKIAIHWKNIHFYHIFKLAASFRTYRVFKEQVYICQPYADQSSMDKDAKILFIWTPKYLLDIYDRLLKISVIFQYGSLWNSGLVNVKNGISRD